MPAEGLLATFLEGGTGPAGEEVSSASDLIIVTGLRKVWGQNYFSG